MILSNFAELSADYAEYHRTRGNRLCHALGIPLIAYAVVAWSRVGSPFPIVALVLPVYFLWDFRVGALMTSFMAVSALIAERAPGWTSWAAFVLGWAFQFVGHAAYEKKSPAFAKNLAHLLVGPAWVATELAGLGESVNIWVQRAAPTDWAEISRVCAATGLAGAPVEDDERAAFTDHWIRPYRELRPDWTWVAVCDKAVIGYLTAAPDTLAFEKERRRVFNPAPDSRDFFPQAVRLKLWVEHPAHLMMNVLSDYRGMGAGTKLLHAFFAELRRAKIPSAHLVCGPSSFAFFERMAFRAEAAVTPAPSVILRAMTRPAE